MNRTYAQRDFLPFSVLNLKPDWRTSRMILRRAVLANTPKSLKQKFHAFPSKSRTAPDFPLFANTLTWYCRAARIALPVTRKRRAAANISAATARSFLFTLDNFVSYRTK